MDAVNLTFVVPDGDAGGELTSFAGWLREDENLRHSYELVRAPLRPGKMGDTVSHLAIELADPTTVSAFVVGLWQWQRHRRATIRAKVTGSGGSGVELELTGLTRAQVDELLPSLAEGIQQVYREG